MELITIDLGNFNIKTSKGLIFENRFLLDNTNDIFGAETITIDENTYFIGKGKFEKEYNKINKNYIPSLLYALAKSTYDDEVNIIIGLPVAQISLKNKIAAELTDKTFEFKVNDVNRKIHINKCGVVKEGFSSLYALQDRKGRKAILDIGGRTVNVVIFQDAKEVNSFTINMGTLNFFDMIASHENSKGGNFTIEEINEYILHGGLDINNYIDIIDKFVDTLQNEIKLQFPNINMYKVLVTGGGSLFFYNALKSIYDNVELMENAITSNVQGNYKIGEVKGWAI